MVSVRKKQPELPEEIVEKGDIYFAYRPRIEEREARGLEDVQRFCMIMKPEGQARFRVAVLGRKRLPEAAGHERIWGFIESVSKEGGSVERELREHQYSTQTRGERTLPSARPAGGRGRLCARPAGPQPASDLRTRAAEAARRGAAELNIEPQAAYVLSVKNPETESPPGAGLPEREEARYPKSLVQEFRGRRFISEDPHLLDYEGAEFILAGARTDPERAYDIDIGTEPETARTADIFRQLEMSAREHPVEPLLKGEWR